MESHDKYDIKGFSDDLGLTMDALADLYAELIMEINTELARLQDSIDRRDRNAMREILHNLKGISGNYRISDIHDETVKIQASVKALQNDNVEPLFQNYFILCNNAVEEIIHYFERDEKNY